jgi:acyl-coenzyme A thioesterase PaaI-like protein
MNPNAGAFIKLMKHPVKFRMFLFVKLPSAFFSGVRLRDIDAAQCRVTVPFKWFSQNPFKSTYFACLAMAAEMSTGVLGLMQLHKRSPSVSMLVVSLEANYFKKATDRTSFICGDGELIQKAVDEAITTGEARMVKAKSVGRNKEGEVVAEFYIIWSFKAKLTK